MVVVVVVVVVVDVVHVIWLYLISVACVYCSCLFVCASYCICLLSIASDCVCLHMGMVVVASPYCYIMLVHGVLVREFATCLVCVCAKERCGAVMFCLHSIMFDCVSVRCICIRFDRVLWLFIVLQVLNYYFCMYQMYIKYRIQ